MPKEKIFNIPNTITLLRLILLAPVLMLVHSNKTTTALILYAIFLFTDVLDGYLARKLRQETDFGEYFDFIVDFVGYYALIIYFIVAGRVVLLNTVLIAIATLVLFWIAVTLSRKAQKLYMPHRTSSKVMAVLLNTTIAVFMIRSLYENVVFFVALAVIFVYTIMDYVRYAARYKAKEK